MNSNNSLSALFAYKAWADGEMMGALLDIEPSSADEQLHVAIRTLNHNHVVDRIFIAHLLGKEHGYTVANTVETPTVSALHAAMIETNAWYQDYVEKLTQSQLEETVHFTFTDGLHGSMSRKEILLHVITHATYHRGGVGRMLVERGMTAPPDTFTRFLHLADPGRRNQ